MTTPRASSAPVPVPSGDLLAERLADRDVLRTLAAEPLVGLGAGRALLMQLAHPAVARGVAEHSDFAERPLARLFGTLDFLLVTTFGTPDEVGRIAAKVRGIHGAVRGEGYSGNDPDLQLWVNATLIDSALYIYENVMRPGDGEPDLAGEYYRQARIVAEVLGCPLDAQPPDLASFRAYMAEAVASLEVTDTAREVAAAVLYPRKLRALAPALAVFRLVTTALLPEPLRDQYGLPWTHNRRRAADLVLRTATDLHHLTPAFLRRPPRPLLVRLARHRVDRTLASRRDRRRRGRP
ncbi:oxygenase MpaB family protein [Actinomadura montaniterrae]|uniref:oxygenase MpaB family protein n=1 Tax=Actinomadura montaniterrae TaxID=1803903 RepID=UPI001CEF8611|nr:oxygenase MpaB family protein [Actinomadura montaniterrae]